MNLLVADDNEINLKVACAYLKAVGIPAKAIKTAANGIEAKTLCSKNHFDMVFMDIQMPELDGLEATRQILKDSHCKPKIIALTANVSDVSEQECLCAGMEMVIHKPVKKSSFIKALKLIDYDLN
jgi:CheY-like chemotaxis protein